MPAGPALLSPGWRSAADPPRLGSLGLGPVQGEGLALGVATRDEEQAQRIKAKCLKEGLVVATEGGVVTLFPPLVIDEVTAMEGLEILERCAAA
jgi:4-aminobutyrate aminotransferase-like enzyme